MPLSTLITRATLTGTATLALILSVAAGAHAQDSAPHKLEFRVSSGSLLPTGEQHNKLRNAQLTGAQLSWVVAPRLAINGNFSWARSRDLASTDNPRLDVFTSDIGAELRTATIGSKLISISAFAGAGGGVRSYNYRKIDAPATHNIAGYGSIGGEARIGRVGLRLEVRDYVSGFKPLLGVGESVTGNDIVIMGALRFHKRRAAQ